MTDETLFSDALALPDVNARAAFLAEACPDPVQRQRVAELLAAVGGTNPLDRPPVDLGKTGAYQPMPASTGPRASVGDRVGPYKLLEQIGEGGMGEVWVADQLEPIKRRVAIKLIKSGMDSRSILGRFEAERQALAVMDHPNIAKVLDAGTTPDGRPYFVMELVKGTPITEFCDARKLTPTQRLELFVPVCQAIQHAHMKGIIHRDIKPGNVLVALHDETPVPKVIDFGVAKAVGQQLTDKTIYTGFGALVGTPAYMAPEQATFNQLDVDTRADVYALGVLLYELLAGSPPIEKERLKLAALDEVLRIVRDEEPPRPSARLSTSQAKASIAATRQSDPAKLSALMKGEIDWIVMKALEKDRTRRYESANGLAKDIQRYLSGDSVEACPPTLGYRLRKAYRKNRNPIRMGLAFAVLLLGGIVATSVLAVQATRAERDAEARRQEAVENAGRADMNARTAQSNEDRAQREAAQVLAEQDRIRHLLYASEMASGSTAFNEGRDARVLQVLADTTPKPGEPDLRGWEWHHLKGLYDTPVREVQLGTPSKVGSQVVDLAGMRALVTRYDTTANKVWFEVFDTATGRLEARIPKEGAISVRLSANGSKLTSPAPTPVLDAGGRHLAVRIVDTDRDKWITRIRLWRLQTGEELDGPPAFENRASGLSIGPDAEWMAWFEPNPNRDNTGADASRTVTVRRWVRADKGVTEKSLTTEVPMRDWFVSPDGNSASATPVRQMNGGPGLGPKQSGGSGGIKLEYWDLTADPPKLRYPALMLGTTESAQHVFNRERTAVAIWDGKDVAVCGLTDGKELWRHTLVKTPARYFPNRQSDIPGYFLGLIAVRDDGRRVVFRDESSLTIVDHSISPKPSSAREWVIRYRPSAMNHLADLNDPINRFQREGMLNVIRGTVSADGRTVYFGPSSDTMKLGMIDLSADPQWGGPQTRPQRTVERVGGGENSYIIRDADGHELYSIKHARTGFRQQVSLAAERWLVSNNPVLNRVSPLPEQDGTIISQGAWELHDVSDPKATRLVASGMGQARMSPDNRWLFVTNESTRVTPTVNGTKSSMTSPTTVTIYRTETGEKVREVSAPPGMVFTPPKFELGGKRWAAFTSPTPRPRSTPISGEVPANQPTSEATPIPSTLRVFDTETGRELLAKDIGASSTLSMNSVTFSRDGRCAFVFSVEKPGVARVQVVKLADGTVENTFAAAAENGLHFWEETPDGKLILSASGELQLWDPLTGLLIHRLTGHSTVFKVVSSPDSRRLFVLDGRGGSRIHVWDLVSGRELLVLPTNQFDVRGGEWTFTLADGKVRYSSTDGMRVLDGTPRPEQKK